MPDYLLLMHDDAVADETGWEAYLRQLRQAGVFEGGSEIGDGICARKSGAPGSISGHLTGFIRITAESIDQAKTLLIGNPQFEAGGTVEIRELPPSD